MKTINFLLIIILFSVSVSFSNPGDTTVVKTFSFSDITKRRGTFPFPNDNRRWAKILMIRTLKCDAATTHDKYPCGEWDYTTNTLLYVPRFPGDTVKEIFELENFVTPYGKNLDYNGEKGWSYVYDVTDYSPLLKGEVDLSSGNQQELLDMKFIFIEGIPPRDVIEIRNLYKWGMYNYGELSLNNKLGFINIPLRTDARGYKLKARITGHREVGAYACCEWQSKTHRYTWGKIEFREILSNWIVWKDCGRNPVFPQGGTWPFDRAGWCPGSPAQIFEFELSNKFKPGDTITNFDYEIEPFVNPVEKDGEFVESHQIVFYSSPNFKNDAAVEEIIAPNSMEGFRRDNPICGSPRIVIKNTGTNILQSLKITYGLSKGEKSVFLWHGYLQFLDTHEIYLPVPIWKGLEDDSVFVVTVAEPNGITDEYEFNNTLSSVVSIPGVMPEKFVLHIEANDLGRAKENAWSVSDGNGKIFFNRPYLEDDAVYDDVIELPEGCYVFLLIDKMEDGMMKHWWEREHPERIGKTAKLRIISIQGDTLMKFPADFGQELRFCFRVGNVF